MRITHLIRRRLALIEYERDLSRKSLTQAEARLAEAEAEIAKLQSNWSNTIATHDETAARLANLRKWALDGMLLLEELEAIESGEWWESASATFTPCSLGGSCMNPKCAAEGCIARTDQPSSSANACPECGSPFSGSHFSDCKAATGAMDGASVQPECRVCGSRHDPNVHCFDAMDARDGCPPDQPPYIIDQQDREIERLREALHKLIEAADDSDGCQYGTLGTSFVRDIARAALEPDSPSELGRTRAAADESRAVADREDNAHE